MPSCSCSPVFRERAPTKREGGSGSTNAPGFITEKRPTMIATFEDGTKLEGMLDSGADATFSGLGDITNIQQSARALKGADPDGD